MLVINCNSAADYGRLCLKYTFVISYDVLLDIRNFHLQFVFLLLVALNT